jgi:hypothetical protein
VKLIDLDPEFLRYGRDPLTGGAVFPHVDNLADAQGVSFLCPHCFQALGGARGCHSVICWSAERGVPATASPGPGRWRLVGNGVGDLTLDAEPPCGLRSVVLNTCGAHFFVTNGEVTPA